MRDISAYVAPCCGSVKMHNRMMQPLQTLATIVRPATESDRSQLESLQTETWGEAVVAANGRLYDLREFPTLVALDAEGRIVGALAYEITGDANSDDMTGGEMEIVSIEASVRHGGVGTRLLDAATEIALAANLRRLWLITTNDNIDALRFYQRRGLRLQELRPGAVNRSRRLKPGIPMIGEYGIPIRDEIVLARDLGPKVEL
jgi:ribosomal protein S18 acetylase RimI-like enzyme